MYLNIEAALIAYAAYWVVWPIVSIAFSGGRRAVSAKEHARRHAEWKKQQSAHRLPS